MKRLNFLSLIIALAIPGFAKAQSFVYQQIGDSVGYGQPAGNDIVVQGDIVNNGNTMLEIDIIRKENNLPPGWDSYLCADICLAPFVDSTRLYLPANSTQNFKLSFMTTNVLDTGNCLIVLKNVNNPGNKVVKRYYGITSTTAGLKERLDMLGAAQLSPNPARDRIHLQSAEEGLHISCMDAGGKQIPLEYCRSKNGWTITTASLSPGVYSLRLQSRNGMVHKKFVKE